MRRLGRRWAGGEGDHATVSPIRSRDMSETVVVAIVGIVGTLLAPVIAEGMRRNSAHITRMTDERIVAYTELLRATAQLADNAKTWTVSPSAELQETDDAELDRVISHVRVVASDGVHALLDELWTVTHLLRRHLHITRLFEAQIDENTHAEVRSQADDARASLAEATDGLSDVHRRLESAIRNELRR